MDRKGILRLDDLCAIPDPLASLEQHQRHSHQDVPFLSLPLLRFELGGVELRLRMDPTPDPWLAGRYSMLSNEIMRRIP